MGILLAAGALVSSLRAENLKPKTLTAYEAYVKKVEAEIDGRIAGRRSFLWMDESPKRTQAVRNGELLTEAVNNGAEIPDGLVHDWISAMFIPGATLPQVSALVRNYGDYPRIYGPEISKTEILSHEGDRYRVRMLLFKKKVITVVLDTEHEIVYQTLGDRRLASRSFTPRISEVENYGKPDEKTLPDGEGHGFLWRLRSYWRFEERDGGVYLESRSVSLTRDVPTGLGWLIEPIVRKLPSESLVKSMNATRNALRGKPPDR